MVGDRQGEGNALKESDGSGLIWNDRRLWQGKTATKKCHNSSLFCFFSLSVNIHLKKKIQRVGSVVQLSIECEIIRNL